MTYRHCDFVLPMPGGVCLHPLLLDQVDVPQHQGVEQQGTECPRAPAIIPRIMPTSHSKHDGKSREPEGIYLSTQCRVVSATCACGVRKEPKSASPLRVATKVQIASRCKWSLWNVGAPRTTSVFRSGRISLIEDHVHRCYSSTSCVGSWST